MSVSKKLVLLSQPMRSKTNQDLHVCIFMFIALYSDCLIGLFASVVIGQSNNTGTLLWVLRHSAEKHSVNKLFLIHFLTLLSIL